MRLMSTAVCALILGVSAATTCTEVMDCAACVSKGTWSPARSLRTHECEWCGVAQVCTAVGAGSTQPSSCIAENCATFSQYGGCAHRRELTKDGIPMEAHPNLRQRTNAVTAQETARSDSAEFSRALMSKNTGSSTSTPPPTPCSPGGDGSTDDDGCFYKRVGTAATGDAGDDDDIEYGAAAMGKCSALMSAVENNCGSFSGSPAEQIAEGIIKALAGDYDCTLPSSGTLDATVEQVGSMLVSCFEGTNDGSKCDGSALVSNLGSTFKQIVSVIDTCQEQHESVFGHIMDAFESIAEGLVPGLKQAIGVFDIAIDGNKIYNSLHAAHYYYAKKEYGCCGMQLANTLQALKSLSSAAENAFESLMSNSTLARQPKKEKTVSPEPDSTDVTTIAIGASAFVAAAALLAVAIRRRRNAASALENGSAQEDASVVAADASNGL